MAKKTEEQETKTVAPTEEQEPKTVAPAEKKADEVEMVEIQLFKDAGKYSSDVTVVVNGKVYQIQRGVKVRVPRFVAEVLENQTRQDNATADLIERESSAFENKSKELGL